MKFCRNTDTMHRRSRAHNLSPHRLIPLCLLLCGARSAAKSLPPLTLSFNTATSAERALLIKSVGADELDGMRHVEPGQYFVYGFPLSAGARCRLELVLNKPNPDALPDITVFGTDNRPYPSKTDADTAGVPAVVWTVPDSWPLAQRMRVMISARRGAFDIQGVRLIVADRDSQAADLPDAVLQWMTDGLPGARATVARPPDRPTTVTSVNGLPAPDTEPLTDAVLLSAPGPNSVAAWKSQGYAVWARWDSRLPSNSALNQQSVQSGSDGKPIVVDGTIALSPTHDQAAVEAGALDPVLDAGVDALLLGDSAYSARAGYEPAFRQEWRMRLGTPWLAPSSSVGARHRAGQFMAQIASERVNTLLQATEARRPGTERLVTIASPVDSLLSESIFGAWRISMQPAVQDVIGEVSPRTMLTPARTNGTRRILPFDQAYLGFSALDGTFRDLPKRLWFTIDAPTPQPEESKQEAQNRYEQQITAALLLSDVASYQTPPLSGLDSDLQPDLIAEMANVNAALAQMHPQPRDASEPPDDIGVVLSDTAQWQRESPQVSDLDGLYGLVLPLLQRGIPVQLASLERTVDPGYLNRFRTLLLSYDFQKPFGAQTQAALADWVRRGGSLLFFGGSDPYNAAESGWWRLAGMENPQADLWRQLGLDLNGAPTTRTAKPEMIGAFDTVLTRGPGARSDSVDLSRYTAQTGSVAVNFTVGASAGRDTASVTDVALRISGQLAASFVTGSDVENRFLVTDRSSRFGSVGRTIDADGAFTYQFDNLPRGVPITLQIDTVGPIGVQAAAVRPEFGNTLLTTGRIAGLADLFPRLRIGTAYAATVYPLPSLRTGPGPSLRTPHRPADDTLPVPLYALRSGGIPVWMQTVGRGHLFYVGVAPGFFSSSARSGGLLRAMTRLAEQRAGGVYRETDVLRQQRGRFTVVKTFESARLVEGRTLNLFSPTLDVAEDRTVPPRSVALLCDLGPAGAPPHIGFVAGRLQARVETPSTTSFFVRGSRLARGLARLHSGGRQIAGVKAIDRLGRAVAVTAEVDGSTVLLRYASDPAGIAIRVGWR